MSTTMVMNGIGEASPRFKARAAGFFWLMTILTGAVAMFVGGSIVVNLTATACYAVATVLVYSLLKPVNSKLSMLAAIFSLAGCIIGTLGVLRLASSPVNPLVFFGLHCLLVGYVIFRSTFLPRILGVLLAVGGLGWLTFALPPLANALSPYIVLPGILGEGALTLWLLVVGVNEQRWRELARANSGGAE
jgi:hypothetical protein